MSDGASLEGFSIAIHGGAGAIHCDLENGKPKPTKYQELQKQTLKDIYRKVFHAAEKALEDIKKFKSNPQDGPDESTRTNDITRIDPDSNLGGGGCLAADKCLELVMMACQLFEESGIFNAGRGAVLTSEPQRQECESSIMCGSSAKCGAASLLRRTAHPSFVAHTVLKHTEHCYVAGETIEAFAETRGAKMLTDEEINFWEDKAKRKLAAIKKSATGAVDFKTHSNLSCGGHIEEEHVGETVGCTVSIAGHVAACTSTGGREGKMPGRIGDSAVVGAGVWANNGTAAISTTGHGECFQRRLGAYDIHARLKYNKSGGLTVNHPHECGTAYCSRNRREIPILNNFTPDELQEAVEATISEFPKDTAGIIAADKNGNLGIAFNTDGMYRAYGKSCQTQAKVGIWHETEDFDINF